MIQTQQCFHCDEAVPSGTDLYVDIFEHPRIMCCVGCQAVSQSIVDNGLTNYYKHRSEKGVKADTLVPAQLQEILAYDHSEIAQDFVTTSADHKEAILSVENVTCAACAWLIEGKLIKLAGIIKCNVNTTTSRISIAWDSKQLKLSSILLAIAEVGYKAYPFQQDKAEQQEVATTKAHLRKLVVAGLCTMQVMMFALASYFDAIESLSYELNQYFRWISLIIVLPVVTYSAQPFYKNAWLALSARRVNMDIPVSIAIPLAFGASVLATINNNGEVYFESVSMFAFFLLLGRFFEQRAKQRAAQVSSNLLKLIPTTATIVMTDGEHQQIPAKTLNIDDVVLVKPGETIPGDGTIISGQSHANEAVLTGEQAPVTKSVGDWVFASTINIDSPITVTINKTRSEQLISQIIRLQEQASHDKPRLATLADRLSQYIVLGILGLSALTYIGWSALENPHALWYAVAVLVATCPCALSLATPSAFTCADAALSSHGLLLRGGSALDTLKRVDHICFDKTGTLTTGHFSIEQTIAVDKSCDPLAIAAALEAHSQHPIGQAFKPHKDVNVNAQDISAQSGGGIEGVINGVTYRLGNARYTNVNYNFTDDESRVTVFLATSKGSHIATFLLQDQLRAQSKPLINFLDSQSISTTLLTGDGSNHGKAIGSELGILDIQSGQTPAQKLSYIESLQRTDKVVAMFGDGVNDAPVLAGAHLSFAMGSGSDIAKSSADIILLHDDLGKVRVAVELAHRVDTIIKQNFSWALGYNLLAVPFAVFGYLPPYLAALGMSLSSVIVVVNSLRLLKSQK